MFYFLKIDRVFASRDYIEPVITSHKPKNISVTFLNRSRLHLMNLDYVKDLSVKKNILIYILLPSRTIHKELCIRARWPIRPLHISRFTVMTLPGVNGRFPFDQKFQKFQKFKVGKRMEQAFSFRNFWCTSRNWRKIPENRNKPSYLSVGTRAVIGEFRLLYSLKFKVCFVAKRFCDFSPTKKFKTFFYS